MPEFRSYCEAVASGKIHKVHTAYHDNEYGFPLESDDDLFARLVLEINQAGLSWETILKKKEGFYQAYDQLVIEKVAAYDEEDRFRLLNDPTIIRNKLKVNAAIHNARVIQGLQKEHGSFKNWLDKNHPLTRNQWVKLFKKHFKFTGGEITNEFLMSSGYLKGAHEETCPVYREILKEEPKWAEAK